MKLNAEARKNLKRLLPAFENQVSAAFGIAVQRVTADWDGESFKIYINGDEDRG